MALATGAIEHCTGLVVLDQLKHALMRDWHLAENHAAGDDGGDLYGNTWISVATGANSTSR
eukprot:2555589-Lingulodinium_polyedra.AAC.1